MAIRESQKVQWGWDETGPVWGARAFVPKSGQDHLGLGSVCSDRILPSLSPGINVLTIHPRHACLTTGRIGPAAAGGLLSAGPRSGPAAVGAHIAGETGGTARRPDQRWFCGLYPGSRGATPAILLCDSCFQAAAGLLAGCEDGCPHDPRPRRPVPGRQAKPLALQSGQSQPVSQRLTRRPGRS